MGRCQCTIGWSRCGYELQKVEEGGDGRTRQMAAYDKHDLALLDLKMEEGA